MWRHEVRLFSFHVSVMSSAVHCCAALSHGHPGSTVFGQHYAALPQTLFSSNPAVRKRSLLGLDHQCPVSFSTTVLAASVRCQEWYYLEEWQRGRLPRPGEHGLYGNTHSFSSMDKLVHIRSAFGFDLTQICSTNKCNHYTIFISFFYLFVTQI